MSRAINKHFISGHLTADATYNISQNGTVFYHFNVAVNERTQKGDTITNYIRVTYLSKNDTYVKDYLKKGAPVYCIGSLQNNSYEKDGKKYYSNNLLVGFNDESVLWHGLNCNQNISIMMGRISSELDYRAASDNGKAYCSFNVAIDRNTKPDDNGKIPADFIQVKCFGNKADFASSYFNKGALIHVIGSINTSTYVKKDGTKEESIAVVAKEISFAEKKKEDVSQQTTTQEQQNALQQDIPQDQYIATQEIPSQISDNRFSDFGGFSSFDKDNPFENFDLDGHLPFS